MTEEKSPLPARSRLTVKEQRFVEFYLGEAHYNGTEACRLAGYSGNDNVLAVTASRLLRKAKISEFINARLAQTAMSASEILLRLSGHARGSMASFITTEILASNPVLRFAAETGQLHLLKEVQFDPETGRVRSFKLYDAQEALVQLARARRLFEGAKTEMEKDEEVRAERAAQGVMLERAWNALEKSETQEDGKFKVIPRVERARQLAEAFKVDADALIAYDLERQQTARKLLTSGSER